MRGAFSHSASLSARTLAACHRSGSALSCSSLYCSSGVPSPTSLAGPLSPPVPDDDAPALAEGVEDEEVERARGERE